LLSCIEFEICFISHPLPVTSRHFGFPYSSFFHSWLQSIAFSSIGYRWNIGKASGIRMLSYEKLRYRYISSLATAILYISLPVRSGSQQNSTIGNLNRENMGVTVGISLLSCIQTEYYNFDFVQNVPIGGLRKSFPRLSGATYRQTFNTRTLQ